MAVPSLYRRGQAHGPPRGSQLRLGLQRRGLSRHQSLLHLSLGLSVQLFFRLRHFKYLSQAALFRLDERTCGKGIGRIRRRHPGHCAPALIHLGPHFVHGSLRQCAASAFGGGHPLWRRRRQPAVCCFCTGGGGGGHRDPLDLRSLSLSHEAHGHGAVTLGLAHI